MLENDPRPTPAFSPPHGPKRFIWETSGEATSQRGVPPPDFHSLPLENRGGTVAIRAGKLQADASKTFPWLGTPPSSPPSLPSSPPIPHNAGFCPNKRILPYASSACCQQVVRHLKKPDSSAVNRIRNSPRGICALAQVSTASDSLAVLLDGHVDALGNPVTRQADLSRRRKVKDKCFAEHYVVPGIKAVLGWAGSRRWSTLHPVPNILQQPEQVSYLWMQVLWPESSPRLVSAQRRSQHRGGRWE